MVGKKCVRPLRAKHSNWCGMASIIQAIVETFPNNCVIMFPQAPAPVETFSTTFRLVSSEKEDDDDVIGPNIRRFDAGTPAPSSVGCGNSSDVPHSRPPLCLTEGISSCQVTGRRRPAVLLVCLHRGVINTRHYQWTKT